MSALNEFNIIERFFANLTAPRSDVLLGIGDDCALVAVPEYTHLAISCDTLIAGIHFPVNTSPFDIGYKALAVNLSDLAAMGAEPAWFTLALTLTEANEQWLREFAQGLTSLMQRFGLQLIGGDTTHGNSLSITIQVHGFTSANQALYRHAAKPNDDIYVTGELGAAGLALQLLQQGKLYTTPTHRLLLQRLNRPEPRLAEGLALRGIAHAAIDISDGLAADLQHILHSSKLGANIYLDQLPIANLLHDHLSLMEMYNLALTAGDDYELCFTAPPDNKEKISNLFNHLGTSCTWIGKVINQSDLCFIDAAGNQIQSIKMGYQHFY